MGVNVGISGGLNYGGKPPFFYGLSPLCFHDSAVAIIVDGKVKCALEEERLSRIKHTNSFPSKALQACMETVGITLDQVDTFSFFFEEKFYDIHMSFEFANHGGRNWTNTRQLLANHITTTLHGTCDPSRIHFVRHHDAHCIASYYGSRFSEALVIVLDGNGENESTSIYQAIDGECQLLRNHSIDNSLGVFYRQATILLGFGNFDEYKVMGLAPYGDPEPLWNVISKLYKPEKDGFFKLESHLLPSVVWDVGIRPREKGGGLTSIHNNFAASVQKLLERIMFDILIYWKQKTNFRNLCISGGVAHNCAMNGFIARKNMFDAIYVHPASHDAGSALGAALITSKNKKFGCNHMQFSPIIGPKIETPKQIGEILDFWEKVIKFKKVQSVHELAAHYISEGAIIGWVQGASEFGPRALGNRSILADPRPANNRERINCAIKKREGFRPFAPAVLAEKVDQYFKIPKTSVNLNDMVCIVEVKPKYKTYLGAVVHIDGTVRIQSVDRHRNPDFWKLIYSFNEITKCGVLLNTSFNNNFEPIVHSARTAGAK
ncbi:MAG: hypothetical protein LWX08_13495, partial [Deltaproteobacteria bacterium]|nr:hypothetical protein [Deltaproteobacteria bacterium]